MKRQITLGFTAALLVGAGLLMAACNKHPFDDTEFDKGVKVLFQKHHEGGGHDDHAEGNHKEHSKAAHDDHGKSDHKDHDHSKADHKEHKKAEGQSKEEHKAAPAKKSLFPKK